MVQPDILVSIRIDSSGVKYLSTGAVIKAVFSFLKVFFASGVRINELLELFSFVLVPLDIIAVSLCILETTRVYESVSLFVATRACESVPVQVPLGGITIPLCTVPLNAMLVFLYTLQTTRVYESISIRDGDILVNSVRGVAILLNPLMNL